MYDVIVAGARCAGAAAALLFARRGYRVLLLERDRFPSDTMSTLYIQQLGIERLVRWGLLDAVVASGCPRLDRIRYQSADVVLEAPMPAWAGSDATYAPRRRVLDQILVDAAVAAGADFADGCTVAELSAADGRVTGAAFRTPAGALVREPARLVVGADGMRSTVAKLARAPETVRDPLLSCVYYSAWQGLPATFGFTELSGMWLAVIPTHDDTTILATYVPQERFAQVRLDPWKAHREVLAAAAPELHERTADREPLEPLRGSGDQQNFFRRAGGPGWALVGDAGHHRDSITAHGITDAFLSAELLVECVGERLRDEPSLRAALSEFGARRDAALTESYRSTLTLARLRVDESRLAVMRAVSTVPDLTRRFFSVLGGIMPMNDLVTPELLALLARDAPRPAIRTRRRVAGV